MLYLSIGLNIVLIIIIIFMIQLHKRKTKKAVDKNIAQLFDLFFEQNFTSRLDWFQFLNKKQKQNGILFVGDSITQEFQTNECFPDKLVYNRGIGGDTAIGLLKRMKESIYDLQPNKMFLLIGTNDLAINETKPDEVVKHIKDIIERTKEHSPNTTIYLESIYPTNQNYEIINDEAIKNRGNNVIDDINQKLQKLAKELNVTYIDINTKLKDETGKIKPEYTRDGLHLTTLGYEVVLSILSPYI